jgi:hypothetical protein
MLEEESTDDVIVDTEQPDTGEDQSSGDVITDQDDGQVQQEDPQDDFWKNKAMENQRKLDNLVNDIPKMIQEEQSKSNESKQDSQYGPQHLSQLYAFAESEENSTQDKAWARAEIDRINREEQERKFEAKIKKQQDAQQAEYVKQQTLQAVVNDKKFKDALVKDASGNYNWNPNSKLAQVAQGYYSNPKVSSEPEGLMIALKMAYSDTAEVDQVKMKRQNAQLKKQTLTEGGGAQTGSTKPDAYVESVNALRQNPSKENARAAISAYFKRSKA